MNKKNIAALPAFRKQAGNPDGLPDKPVIKRRDWAGLTLAALVLWTLPGCQAAAGIAGAAYKAGINTFIIIYENNEYEGLIDQENKTITAALPYGADLKALVPAVKFTGNKVAPASGEQRDFSGSINTPIVYTVSPGIGGGVAYAVTVRTQLNSAKSISGWEASAASDAPAAAGLINEEEKTVAVRLPFGSSLTRISSIVTHSGMSITPDPALELDYSTPQVFTITAEDGTTESYTVTVIVDADIESFNLTSPVSAKGSIDREKNTITFTVPYRTELNSMTAEAVVRGGAELTPSPSAALNYDGVTQTFTLRAEGQEDKAYAVNVNKMRAGNYFVVYNGNGASGSMQPGAFQFDKDVNLAPNGFSKEGYTFAGWKKDNAGEAYGNNSGVRNLAEEHCEAVLYAQWEETPVRSISLSSSTLSINGIGATTTITAVISPENVLNKGVIWSSSIPGAVSVSSKKGTSGTAVTLKGRLYRTATITAKAAGDRSKKAACKVAVDVPVGGISLNPNGTGKGFVTSDSVWHIAATIRPVSASNQGVIWESNDPGVIIPKTSRSGRRVAMRFNKRSDDAVVIITARAAGDPSIKESAVYNVHAVKKGAKKP